MGLILFFVSWYFENVRQVLVSMRKGRYAFDTTDILQEQRDRERCAVRIEGYSESQLFKFRLSWLLCYVTAWGI